MAKWAVETGPELIPVSIDPRRYQALIAELAEILYSLACQLKTVSSTDKDSSKHDDGGLIPNRSEARAYE